MTTKQELEKALEWYEGNKPYYQDGCECADCKYARSIDSVMRHVLTQAFREAKYD